MLKIFSHKNISLLKGTFPFFLPSKTKFLKNVFKKKNNKKVLVSFITAPFESQINFSHTNKNECYYAGKVFDELGYNVDVIDFNHTETNIDYSVYDVLYGFGDPIENYFLTHKKNKNGPKVLLYLNGSYSVYSNLNGALRVKEVYKSKGVFLGDSARIASNNWTWSHHMADALIVLGNKAVASTYDQLKHDNIVSLNAFFYKNKAINIKSKDFSVAKKNFLWFGNTGLIHKGLDLVLNYFSSHPEFELHICGMEDPNFEAAFITELKKSNIHNYGQIDIFGDQFIQLMMTCGFCVYPSVSEGGAVSVLTCLGNGGLLPIISKSTGLDVDEYGLIIKEINSESLKEAIEKSQSKSDKELQLLSEKILNTVTDLYTLDNYYLNLKNIIKKNI
jgi:hypothetical protein